MDDLFASGLMGGDREIEEYEKGGTPWCITYGFLPDELKQILASFGVTDVKLAGPGAYARTIPNKILVRIMTDPQSRNFFSA